MKMNEAIEKREELLAEQRKINLAIKILKSDSIPDNYGIQYAETLYQERLKEIDQEIKNLAAQVETEHDHTNDNKWTVVFDFEGTKTYPIQSAIFWSTELDLDKILKFDDKSQAECFGAFYAYKHGWKAVRISDL